MEASQRVAVTESRTGVLENTVDESGNRRLVFRPLPMQAQEAPVFGIAVLDLNGDVYPDLFLAQNFFTPQRETGRMSGGLGCLLLNQTEVVFRTVDAKKSGIVVPEDAKSAVSCDLNNDGRVELAITTNDGPIRTYSLVRRRVSGSFSNGESYLGSGYLSSVTFEDN